MSHLFTFNSVKVRVVIIDGEPWFVAKDVCEILGLDQVSRACDRLREKDRGVTLIPTPSGDQQMVIISEFGLYELVLGSRKEEAKQFKYWICDEVLPQIRKTGSYQPAQLEMSNLKEIVQQTIRQELTPIQKELSELRVISTALSSSNGILKQINAQACNDFSEYQMLTFNDVVKKFRPYFAKVPKIVSRARHSVGKVFATEQERELGKISGKYIFSGWEIQTAINCLDRAAKEVFVEYEDSTLPLMDLIEKMDKENKNFI